MRPPKTLPKREQTNREVWEIVKKTNMFQQNLKLKKAYKLVKVIRYLWQKYFVTMDAHFFLKSSKRIKLQFQLNLSNSDMYFELGWLLQFPILLPVAVTTKQRTFCDLFLAGVSSQFAGSCWTWSKGCLWQHSVVTIWPNRKLFSPLAENMWFCLKGDVVFKIPTFAVGSNSTPNCGQMSISASFQLGSHWPH